jgi:hypothetical protein
VLRVIVNFINENLYSYSINGCFRIIRTQKRTHCGPFYLLNYQHYCLTEPSKRRYLHLVWKQHLLLYLHYFFSYIIPIYAGITPSDLFFSSFSSNNLYNVLLNSFNACSLSILLSVIAMVSFPTLYTVSYMYLFPLW